MDFSEVVRGLKQGKRYRRADWFNGEVMYLVSSKMPHYHASIDMINAQNMIYHWGKDRKVGYVYEDVLAEDWLEVKEI